MGKKLQDMTLEELWQLFPIVLTPHEPIWAQWYACEVNYLLRLLPRDVAYYHVGSTAISGITAKPIIDILAVVNSTSEMTKVADILSENGYIIMAKSNNRISLNKGYTENGFAEKVFHLHLRLDGDTDEIYFRDHLNSHPDIAKQYELLKIKLARVYRNDRDAYTEAKTEFVKKYTDLAKETIKDR